MRQVERVLASGAVGGPFAVGLPQGIAEPHDAARIGVMAEPEGVTEFVHRLPMQTAVRDALIAFVAAMAASTLPTMPIGASARRRRIRDSFGIHRANLIHRKGNARINDILFLLGLEEPTMLRPMMNGHKPRGPPKWRVILTRIREQHWRQIEEKELG